MNYFHTALLSKKSRAHKIQTRKGLLLLLKRQLILNSYQCYFMLIKINSLIKLKSLNLVKFKRNRSICGKHIKITFIEIITM